MHTVISFYLFLCHWKLSRRLQNRQNNFILSLAVTNLSVVPTFALWILSHYQKKSLITIYAKKPVDYCIPALNKMKCLFFLFWKCKSVKLFWVMYQGTRGVIPHWDRARALLKGSIMLTCSSQVVHIPGAQTISWKIISYPSTQLLPGRPVIHNVRREIEPQTGWWFVRITMLRGWGRNPDLASSGAVSSHLCSIPLFQPHLWVCRTSCELISNGFYIYFPPLSNFCCLACIFDSFGNTA